MKKYWFTTKRYGWGWTPATWQGWAIILIYCAAITKIFFAIDSQSHSVSDTLFGVAPICIVLTILLILICYLKGEKPRWRWGD
jgi:hypothetical protein